MEKSFLLIQKELIYLFKSLKSTWVMCIIFLVAFPLLCPEIGVAAMAMVPYYLIYGVMAHEEKCQSEAMTLILPVTRKNIVQSKYLLGILYAIMGMLIALVAFKTRSMISPTPFVNILTSNYWVTASMLVTIAVVFVAVILPLIYKFGTIKMRYVIFGLYFIIFASAGAVQSIARELNLKAISLNPAVATVLAIILLIGGYSLSYYVSARIFQKKEF
ncbi:MAG: ABC-2 transporter permease [Cellulosilyticaceae bacterium]